MWVVQVMQNIEGTILVDATVRLDLIASIEQREPAPPRGSPSQPTRRCGLWRVLRTHHTEMSSASEEFPVLEAKVSAPAFEVHTAATAATTGCGQQIHERLGVGSQMANGPIAFEIAFAASAHPNWLNLSKATIDALEMLLDWTRATRGWHPLGGWIDELGLQCFRGQPFGTDVLIYFTVQSIERQAT
jgi:hypothetical protein